MPQPNKCGHALHALDDVFHAVSTSPKVAGTARQLMKSPVAIQSMYIFKRARVGGVVTPHQDSTFLYTEPLSTVAFWTPLCDVSTQNGCLWVLPKSHKAGVYSRFRLNEDRNGTFFTHVDEPDHPCKGADPTLPAPAQAPEGFIPACMKRGDLLLFHGSLIHMSLHNKSDVDRPAFTLHVVDNEAEFVSDNWLASGRACIPL